MLLMDLKYTYFRINENKLIGLLKNWCSAISKVLILI